MPNPYKNDPYSNQNNTYGGAQGNGYTGSQTNKSVQNAQVQQGGRGGSPYQSFGNAAQAWQQTLQNYMAPQTLQHYLSPATASQGQAVPATQNGYVGQLPAAGQPFGGQPISYPTLPQLTPEQQAAEAAERARQSQIPGNAGQYANDPRFDPALDAARQASLSAFMNQQGGFNIPNAVPATQPSQPLSPVQATLPQSLPGVVPGQVPVGGSYQQNPISAPDANGNRSQLWNGGISSPGYGSGSAGGGMVNPGGPGGGTLNPGGPAQGGGMSNPGAPAGGGGAFNPGGPAGGGVPAQPGTVPIGGGFNPGGPAGGPSQPGTYPIGGGGIYQPNPAGPPDANGNRSQNWSGGPENQTPEGGVGGGGLPPAGGTGRPPLGQQTQLPVPTNPGIKEGPSANNWGDPEWLKTSPDAAAARQDPNEAARQYAIMDPRLAGITGEQVSQFRVWETENGKAGKPSTRIEDWFLSLGKPVYAPPAPGPGFSQNTPGGGGGWVPRDVDKNNPPQPGAPGGPPAPAPTPPGEDPMDQTPVGIIPPDGDDPNKPDWSDFDDQTGDLQSILRDLMGPQFEYEQNQLARHARAQAALTGQIDSGGFGANLSAAQAQLGAQQGSRMSDYMFNASEAEKERNANMAVAKMQDDLARLQIKTNDELQRYLQANELELKKYGIDKDDLLRRYEAEMQLRGAEVGAGAQIQAAALQAAAAGAAAAAGLEARRYETDKNYELGILGINRDIYQTDINDRYRYAYLQWLMSPEARLGGGNPFGNLPGQFPF